MAGQTVIVSVLADTARFNSAMRGTDTALLRFQKGLQNINRIGVLAFTSITYAVGRFTVSAVKAAEEAEAIDRKLLNTATSMGLFGDQTKYVVGQLADFADKQEKALAIDGELIKQVQTLLLTFKNVGKTADETGGLFEKLTVLSLDMAAVLETDATSAAIQLGKALNDPIKGITALTKSGVSFTAQQREQIKNYVEQNKLAKAQAIILKEVTAEFGGNAKAGKTASAELSLAFERLQETFGKRILTKLTPAINELSNALDDLAGSDEFTAFADNLAQAFTDLVKSGDLKALVKQFSDLLKAMNDADVTLVDVAKTFVILSTSISVLTASVAPLFSLFQFFNARKTLKTQAEDTALAAKKLGIYNEIVSDLRGKLKNVDTEQGRIGRSMDDLRKAYDDGIISTGDFRHEMEILNNQFGEQLFLGGSLEEELDDVNKQWKNGTLNLQGFNDELDGTNTKMGNVLSKFKLFDNFGQKILLVFGAIGTFASRLVIPLASIAGLLVGIGEGIAKYLPEEFLKGLKDLGTLLGEFGNIVGKFFGDVVGNIIDLFFGINWIEVFFNIFRQLGTAIVDYIAALFGANNQFTTPQTGPGRLPGTNTPSTPTFPSGNFGPATITVNVNALTPSPEVGRVVVKSIQDYQRTGGVRV